MNMDRRAFLKMLGFGAVAAAVPAAALEIARPPERRIWQVSINAPVPARRSEPLEIQLPDGRKIKISDWEEHTMWSTIEIPLLPAYLATLSHEIVEAGIADLDEVPAFLDGHKFVHPSGGEIDIVIASR